MNYLLEIKKPAQAKALLAYLQTLDAVELIPETPKQVAGRNLRTFLGGLPKRTHTQAGVNKAIKELRRQDDGEK